MKQPNQDARACWRQTLRCVIGLLLCVAAVAVAARVEMVNSVAKVETYVDAQGVAQQRLVNAESVVAGDELRYTIAFTNAGEGEVDAGSIVITNPVPERTEYILGSAIGSDGSVTEILFSADQGVTFGPSADLKVVKRGAEQIASAKEYTTIQWQLRSALSPGQTGQVSFNVRLK